MCGYLLSFNTVHEVLMAVHWGGLPFPPPVDHVWSELSTVTHPSWVALHSMAHSFTSTPLPQQVLWLTLNEALMPESLWQLYRKSWKNSEK